MKKFLIIGNPVSHSLSPMLHNYWFKKYKIKGKYSLQKITEEEIKSVIDRVRTREIEGINVTTPFKQKVIPHIDKLINDAKATNSVNTIYLNGDEIIGDNTDVYGIQSGYLKEMEGNNINKKILIIGAGGVTPSVIVSLNKSNLKNITISNRTHDKVIFLKKSFPNIEILKWSEIEKNTQNYDIIINSTSLGLKNGNEFDIVIEHFKKELIYIDLIYNPIETKMIKHFKSNQIKTYNGLDMFIYQGQKAFYLWNKINPEIDQNIINLLIDKVR